MFKEKRGISYMSSLAIAFGIGVAFGLPKLVTYLITKPADSEAYGRVDHIRINMVNTIEKLKNFTGEKTWHIGIKVTENAWISALFMYCIGFRYETFPKPLLNVNETIMFLFLNCSVWIVRNHLVIVSNRLSRLIKEKEKKIEVEETNKKMVALMFTNPILRQITCAISHEPTFHPVADPNGKTIYDRNEIAKWLIQNPTSPVTRLPLTISELKPLPALEALIAYFAEENEEKKSDPNLNC